MVDSKKVETDGSIPPTDTMTTMLPSYPWVDTFFILTILMVLPHWLSTICLILYVAFGNHDVLDPSLSWLLRYQLRLKPTTSNLRHQFIHNISIYSCVMFLATDAICMVLIIIAMPTSIPYIIIFGKAFIASNLTSTRNRYILDAFTTGFALMFIEYILKTLIEYFEIIRSDSGLDISLSFAFSSSPLLYSHSFKTSPSFSKRLIYYLSYQKMNNQSTINFQLELFIQFLHATLSLYTIMHNLNPYLRKSPFIRRIYNLFGKKPEYEKEKEDLKKSSHNASTFSISSENKQGDKVKANQIYYLTYSQTNKPIEIPKEVASSFLPEVVRICCENSNSIGDNISLYQNQLELMTDVSSSTLVVSQNFENYCRSIWSSGEALEAKISQSITNVGPRTAKLKSVGSMVNSSSNLSPSKFSSKIKNFNMEKMKRYHQHRFQQPLWTLLNAARTMFVQEDYYCGDYYSYNAVAKLGEDYLKKDIYCSPNCFIWYTGETVLAFELHNVSLEQLLIEVNGIIWPYVSSMSLYGREMVFVNGLSPLTQYEIKFIVINLNAQLIHMSTIVVSTIYKDRTVTESLKPSPIKTMQKSVTTSKEAIEREKIKLKKIKTEGRKRTSNLKTEIESLNNRPNQTDESRNYKKLENLRGSVLKIDNSITELSREHDKIESKQIEIDEAYMDAKRDYDDELRHFKLSQKQFHNSVDKLGQQVEKLKADKVLLLNKKEKILNKKVRIEKDIETTQDDFLSVKQRMIKNQQIKRNFIEAERQSEFEALKNTLKR